MNPLVSICTLTYNQKDYVAQTIESMLAQKTDFDFEILIHDDASTDGTDDIIRSYAEKYPDIVKPLFETENQFSKEIKNISGIFNFPRAKGKYIAMCEGDDFWNDTEKLQTQVDYMEANDDCTMCLHSAYQFNEGVYGRKIMRPYKESRILKPEEIIAKTVSYPTASLMLKTDIMQKLPEFYMKAPIGDIPMQLLMASEGYAYYMDKPMATYRYFAKGSWSKNMLEGDFIHKQNAYAAQMCEMYNAFDEYTSNRFHDSVTDAKDRLLYKTKVNIREWNEIYKKENLKYYNELSSMDKLWLKIQKQFLISGPKITCHTRFHHGFFLLA